MYYERVFKPDEKAMEKYSVSSSLDSIEKLRDEIINEIIVFCLMGRKDYNVPADIRWLEEKLKMLVNIVDLFEKRYCYERFKEEGKIYICCGNYSNDYEDVSEKDNINETIKMLLIYGNVIATPDFFDKRENFFEKKEVIEETIDNFISNASDCSRYKIIRDLKEFDVTEIDEDDIYKDETEN